MYATCVPAHVYNGAIYSGFIFIQRTAVRQIHTDPLYALKTFGIWRTRGGRKEEGTERKSQDCRDTQQIYLP